MSDPYRHVPTDPVCPLCAHEWRRHDPDDGCCDAHAEEGFGACPCGRNRLWMAGRIAHLSRLFLMSEPAGERTGPTVAEHHADAIRGVLESAHARMCGDGHAWKECASVRDVLPRLDALVALVDEDRP